MIFMPQHAEVFLEILDQGERGRGPSPPSSPLAGLVGLECSWGGGACLSTLLPCAVAAIANTEIVGEASEWNTNVTHLSPPPPPHTGNDTAFPSQDPRNVVNIETGEQGKFHSIMPDKSTMNMP